MTHEDDDEDNQDVQFDPTAFQASCTLVLPMTQHPSTNMAHTHLLAAPTVNNRNAAPQHHRAHPLITATASASGLSASSEASALFVTTKALGDPSADAGAAQHPRHEMGVGMGMGLGSTPDRKSEERVKGLSDVVRCVWLFESALIKDTSCTYVYTTGWKGGFEIYMDPEACGPGYRRDFAGEEVESGAGWGWVWCGCGRGATGKVTSAMKVGKEGGGLKEGQGKEGLGQAREKMGEKETEKEKWWTTIDRGRKENKEKENKTSRKHPLFFKAQSPAQVLQSRMLFNSLDSSMLLNSMSTAPASAFTSNSSAYLSGSSSSATATQPPPAPPKVMFMPTGKDEENTEAE
ncbi:hypothetical protein CVT25_001177 [Psilocybe cyanescens]|uniref:Uncharacterized protein n=1 Tax=Psilocybe cyanescens TaxID=93625 RepID=A0A409XKC5_PSICY|nr:hypothetical protein CVT25_001177 [Psilocybe cyanescens]